MSFYFIHMYVVPWNLIHFCCSICCHLQVVKSLIALLRYYAWNKFSILYEEIWAPVADLLKDQAVKKNMTVNHKHPFMDDYGKCCELMMPCCRSGYWYQVRNQQYTIYIYILYYMLSFCLCKSIKTDMQA